MSFVSIRFLLWLAVILIVYFIVPVKYRWYVVLLSSVYFYAVTAGFSALLIAMLTITIVYIAAIQIAEYTGNKAKSRLCLTTAVVIVLGFLVFFKFQKYMISNAEFLVVPLGVSYYSFSLIAYMADIYHKKAEPERNFLKLFLYTLYFPKIVQGPISRFREISAQFTKECRFSYKDFCFGLQLMLWGYFKKIVIADRAAMIVESVFGDFAAYEGGGAVLLVSTFFAVIRHYCDFSGYMDIVLGISQMMGIKMEGNFKQPFFSRSAAEFWRRWHITLGEWFKDYVYMPLVISPRVIKISGKVRKHFGKRAGKAILTVIPLAVVWLLTGLWHGTGLDYLLWGVYWGTLIILSNVFAPEIKKLTVFLHIHTDTADWHVFQTIRTFALFTVGLLLSTLVGWRNMAAYINCLFLHFDLDSLLSENLYQYGISKGNTQILLIAIIILAVVERLQQKGYSVRACIAKQHAVTRWVVYAAAILTVLFLGIYGPAYDTSSFGYAFF